MSLYWHADIIVISTFVHETFGAFGIHILAMRIFFGFSSVHHEIGLKGYFMEFRMNLVTRISLSVRVIYVCIC
jgi:hypothetical protein